MLYERLIRPLLFRLDAETSHHLALRALSWLNRSAAARRWLRARLLPDDPRLEVTLFGQALPHPIGLAAGFDKNGRAVPALFALGFSFLEIGAVSGRPESGNPRPRIFRLPAHRSLINRMGLPNDGAEVIARRLASLPASQGLVGANIVKAKSVPAHSPEAIEGYARTLELLYPYVHYFSINISSPSSPDLRTLNAPTDLRRLLDRLTEQNQSLAEQNAIRRRGLLLKIGPDLSDDELDDVLAIVTETGLDGIVATNTTAARPAAVAGDPVGSEAGGLSGALLRERATQVIRSIAEKSGGALTILGVGGVFTAEDAWEKLAAGASAVELYTGFLYRGPGIVSEMGRGLVQLLDERRVRDIRTVIRSGVASQSSRV